MKKFYFLACELFMLMIATAQAATPNTITFTDGKTLAAEVLQVEGNYLVCSRELEFGKAAVRLPLNSIASVTFPEAESLASLDSLPSGTDRLKKLQSLWNSLKQFVRVPGTPVGQAGILLARALYDDGSPAALSEAMELLQTLEKATPATEIRVEALSLRLLVMGALGQVEAARNEAKNAYERAGRSEPRVRAAAGYALAQLLCKDLEELERENPRWELDPLVRPDRNRLHHRIVELFLQPYLENGSDPAPAARGLWALAQFHKTNQRIEEAASVAQDIIDIYPNTPEEPLAKEFLQTLQTKS